MFKSSGNIVYSPKSHLGSTKDWAILKCDDNFTNYYNKLFQLAFPYRNGNIHGRITRTVLGSHLSFIRQEFVDPSLWGLNKNKLVEFEYDPYPQFNNQYVWFNVKCDYLSKLRVELGLTPNPKMPFHLTIGLINK